MAVVDDWSFGKRPIPTSVRRDASLPRALSPRIALVVQGVRRCGKSTLMQQMVEHYGLDRARCAFINFEDPRLASHLTWETLEAIVQQFRARWPRGKRTFFFDEIQWVDGWQRWLRSKLERPSADSFVLTGSNAQLLAGELGSSLTGRHLVVELAPFSFAEAKRASRGLTLQQWLQRGGFPEALRASAGDRDRILQQYFSDIVERDVRERVGARSSQPLRQLVQMVFESSGSELSMRRLGGAIGLAVETTQAYVEACEAAYLFFGCPFFAYSERQRAHKNRKFYPIDTALRRVSVTRIGADLGKHLECASYLALRAHGDVSYWRGRGEIDFVLHAKGAAPRPVQVSWDGKKERHLRALEEFYEHFPHAAEAWFVDRDSFSALLGA